MTPDKIKNLTPQVQLLRIGEIAGMHYTLPQNPTKNLVVFGIGAPMVPDSGILPNAATILQHNADIFVPDYIGYGRSDGIFTPENCIETFVRLYRNFTDGSNASNSYNSVQTHLQYDRVIIAGRSFAGTYIPVLPRFEPAIKELGIFYPVVDSKNCGSEPGEETNEQFLKSMREDGYHHIYRGILDPKWTDHLENRDNLSPMDNMQYLKDTRLFIGHGKKDPVVSWKKSVRYYDLLVQTHPDKANQFMIHIYEEGGHDAATAVPATQDMLQWLDQNQT